MITPVQYINPVKVPKISREIGVKNITEEPKTRLRKPENISPVKPGSETRSGVILHAEKLRNGS